LGDTAQRTLGTLETRQRRQQVFEEGGEEYT
jgi:hypothetical protein